MNQIVSLDLGTASIGWAVRDLSEQPSKEDIAASGVVIFPEVVETNKSGGLFTRAKIRREKRLIRRQNYRRKLRKYATLKILVESGMTPLTTYELNRWIKPGKDENGRMKSPEYPQNSDFHRWLRLQPLNSSIPTCMTNIYQMRADALHSDIEKYEAFGYSKALVLGRIFYNFAQRRGFLSNAKQVRNSETSEVKKAIKQLEAEKAAAGFEYISELFASINPMMQRIRARKLDRSMYEKEFIQICKLYPEICAHFHNPSKEMKLQGKRTLANALFRVRPLKSQKHTVGHCILEPERRRIHLSHPDFERFRILQFLQNISIKIGEEEKERIPIEAQLFLAEKISFEKKSRQTKNDLQEILTEFYQSPVKISSENKFPCPNCPTTFMLNKMLGPEWKSRTFERKVIKSGRVKIKQIGWEELWHFKKEVKENEEKFIQTESPCYQYAMEIGLDENAANLFEDSEIAKGYASLSDFVIKRIMPFLETGTPYHLAVVFAGIKRIIGEEEWEKRKDQLIPEITDFTQNNEIAIAEVKCFNGFIRKIKEDGIVPEIPEIEESLKFISGKPAWRKWNKKDQNGNRVTRQIIERIHNEINVCIQANDLRFDEFPLTQKAFVKEEVRQILEESGLDQNKIEKKCALLYHHSEIDKWKPAKKIQFFRPDGDKIEVTQLQTPYTGALQNPAAMRCLHEVKKLINYLLREGIIRDPEETRVVIEMGRELNEMNKRRAIKQWQEWQEQENTTIREFISEHLKLRNPGEDQIKRIKLWLEQTALAEGEEERRQLDKKLLGLKKSSDTLITMMKLWKEQKGICLYSGKSLSPTDILEGQLEIEHTIPRSLSNDTRLENLTLATQEANRKKGNRIPAELLQKESGLDDIHTIRMRLRPWIKRLLELDGECLWDKMFDGIGWIEDERAIIQRKSLAKKKGEKNTEEGLDSGLIFKANQRVKATKVAGDAEKYSDAIRDRWLYRFERDYWKQKIERFFIDEVSEGFSRRQLVDTQVITKYACGWLKTVFPVVRGTNGQLTSVLRKHWGLQAFHEKKDRTDHTHHEIDALVNAFVDPTLYNRLTEVYRKQEEGKKNFYLPAPWNGFAQDILEKCENTLVFHVYRDRTLKQTRKRKTNGRKGSNSNGIQIGRGIKFRLHDETALAKVRSWIKNEEGKTILANEKNTLNPYIFAARPLSPGFEGTPVYPRLQEYHSTFSKREDNRMMPVRYLRNFQDKKVSISSLTIEKLKDLKKNEINDWFKSEVSQKGLETVQNEGFFIRMNKWRKVTDKKSPPEIREVMKAFQNPNRPHKAKMYYQNEGNYLLALYKHKGEKKELREILIIPYWEIQSRRLNDLLPNSLTDKKGNQYLLSSDEHGKQIYQLNKRVLLYQESPNEIWENPYPENLSKRLFIITGINSDTRMNFLIHYSTGFEKEENIIKKLELKGGKSSIDINPPLQRISSSKINALIEGIDFRITYDGKLIKL